MVLATKPGWVVPSMTVVSVAAGRAEVGATVQIPAAWPGSVAGMANQMVSTGVVASLASSMAARRVHSGSPSALVAPVSHRPSPVEASTASPVELTTTRSGDGVAEENSEVDPRSPPPRSSVAAAVSTVAAEVTVSWNGSAPDPVWVTVAPPSGVSPSPLPLGSAAELANSSMR